MMGKGRECDNRGAFHFEGSSYDCGCIWSEKLESH